MANLVELLLNFLGYDLPLRKLNIYLSRVLLLTAFLLPGTFAAGLLMYAHDQQCKMEGIFTSSLSDSKLPKYTVVHTNSGCELKYAGVSR